MNFTQSEVLADLENLNEQSKKSSKSENFSLNIYSALVPEMEGFERLSKFQFTEFQFSWSVLIFFCSLYNFFSAGYFLATNKKLEGSWLGAELVTEALMLIDAILKVLFSRSKQMWFMNECQHVHTWLLLIISSIPYTMIYTLSDNLQNESLVALRFFKLLRIFQVVIFLKNLEVVLWEKSQNAVSLINGIIAVGLISHYSAVAWLFNQKDSSEFEDLDEFSLYIKAYFWATENLTGTVLNKSENFIQDIKFLTIAVMTAGGILYGLMFVKIYWYLVKKHKDYSESMDLKITFEHWCEKRMIPKPLKQRIFSYLEILKAPEMQFLSFKFPSDLPLSLVSELSLFQYKNLISKVKLFELGEPSFVMSMVRSFSSKVFLPGDFIIRLGDLADCMYFINKGLLEVLASDGQSRIALLDEGNYFGEIGILFNCCRTVSIRVITLTTVASIEKDQLLNVLSKFPEHEKFLKKVAGQRIKTCHKEDIDLAFDLVEDNNSSSDSDHSGELECPQYYTAAEHSLKKWWLRFITVPTSRARKGDAQIDPLSQFFNAWSYLLVLCYTLYLFIIPYSIEFGPESELLIVDAICYGVFIVDIFVNYHSSLVTNFKSFIHDRQVIQKNYMDKYFIMDALSIVPADWVYCAIKSNAVEIYYLKLFRLFKLARILSIIQIFKTHSKLSDKLLKLIIYIYIFCIFSHFIACFLNYLETPENSQTYIEALFWSISILSQSSYGNVDPKSLSSKIFSIILILFSKVFYLFLLADSTILIKEKSKIFIEFIKKQKIVEEWMSHCKISDQMQGKVLQFYKYKWEQLKGINDEIMFDILPESISTDLRLNIFNAIIESGLFPSDEKGAILGIIRKCKLITVTQGLNVINKDELGFEMFFILDGIVVIDTGNSSFVKELGPGSMFGEVAILESTPGLRLATVKAKTNLTLASLSVADFKEVARHYSDFEIKVKKLAQERRSQINHTENELINIAPYNSRSNDLDVNDSMLGKHEDSLIEKTILTTSTNESKAADQAIKFRPFIVRFLQSELKNWAVFVFWAWNVIFIPLQVAFRIEYNSILLLIEILNIIFYASISLFYLFINRLQNNGTKFLYIQKKKSLFYCFYYTLISIPFAMIFQIQNITEPKVLTTILSYARISNFPYVFLFFSNLKEKRINWYVFIQLVEVLMVSFTFSHIFACLFITIAYDSSNSWIDGQNLSESISIYLYSFYWSFGTLIHMVQGDIIGVSQSEILFNCLVQLLSIFFFTILFGALLPIITIFGSKLRDKFYSDYSYTMKFIKQKQILKYKFELDNYFNFIWENSRSVIDNEIVDGLPESLKADLFISNYNNVLKSNEIFTLGSSLHVSLIRSIYRLLQFRYSLLGEVVLRIDDLNSKMYFILFGEVTVVSLEGNQILSVLSAGSHFGELNIIFETVIRTATVVATKTSKFFYINADDLNMLFNYYPEFKEKIRNIGEERLIYTFKANNLFEVSQICEKFSEDFDYHSPISRKYTKQAELLISHKVADAKAAIVIDKKLTLSGLHLLLIIYSCIVIPIEITFFSEYPAWILAIELFCFVESAVYLFNRIKNELNLKFSEIFSKNKKIIYDFASISPLNFILPLLGINSPRGLISAIRSIRLLSVFRIHSLLSYLIVYNKKLFLWVSAIETLIFLMIFVNWISCILYFNFSCQSDQSYLSAMYLTMNLLTFTGNTDIVPCSNNLMFIACIIGFFAVCLLSVLYSLLFFLYSKFPAKTLYHFTKLNKKLLRISEKSLPPLLKYKIETYAKFSAALNSNYGETIVKKIYTHLPEDIVHELIHEKLRHILKKVPVFKTYNSYILMKKIALSLQPEIYLPSDYLIYKNDIGEEMYFIAIGSVNIISPDNSKVLKTLYNGDFVGEMALIYNSRRMCSVIASTLCLVYALKKKDFYETLKNFPEVLEKLRQESENRSKETTSVSKSGHIMMDSEDEEQEKLFNHLRMFSLMSATLADENKNSNNTSLLTGMKNIRAETSVDTFVRDRSQNRLYKRRPNAEDKAEKRKSLESLGKELVFERFSNLKMKWMSKE